ncbi:CASP-like protein 1D1 [Silene latifolia]|uniref:CASP-like protein 1D1 n=1 Tax=Silene latifolia TaxID=37657 RepID=UPI003D76F608
MAIETREETPIAATHAPKSGSSSSCMVIDVGLRFLLLASCIVAVVVMATSKQTAMVPVPGLPGITIPLPAKFTNSPAFIYFLVALSVTGLYSIITLITSLSFISKPTIPPKIFLILAVHDVLILGIVAAATGAAGSVGYIGLKGNSHVNWGKICNVYDKFCRYLGTSVFLALFASVLLVILVILNAFSLYKRIL